MKKQILKLAVAAALVSSTAAASAAIAVLFDPDGLGALSAVNLDQFSWAAGNAVFDNTFPGTKNAGFFAGQTSLSGALLGQTAVNISGNSTNPADLFTYQFIMPVTVDTVGGVATVTETASGTFKIFAAFKGVPVPNTNTGLGFGDLNGGALALLQKEILAGSFDLTGGKFNLTDLTAITGGDPGSAGVLGLHNANGRSIATDSLFGSTTLDVTVTSANGDYWKTAFPKLAVGITLESMGLTAPFGGQTDVSLKVVNITPFFGDPQLILSGPALPAGGLVGKISPVNDFACFQTPVPFPGSPPPAVDCDVQVQTSGNSFFNVVPEPDSLALVGFGLLGLGYCVSRKNKKG